MRPRADLVLSLLACGLAVAALLTPWSQNLDCRSSSFLWEMPTRRTPATLTLVSAVVTTVGVLAVAVLSLVPLMSVPGQGRRGRLLVLAGVGIAGVTLIAAVTAALTLPLGTCFWDDSAGGGASESIWGPAPVLLLAAAVGSAALAALRLPRRGGTAD